MAFIELNKSKLKHNYNYLNALFTENNISWGVVSKLLCGNSLYLDFLISLGARQLLDSRVSNLKTIKSLNPDIETIYIKPPPKRSIPSIVRYADISINTEYDTIKRLSEEALLQQKVHKIIIMIELGDLREGVMGSDFIAFYRKVFELPGIDVVGIGANLTCMNGVLPNADKLIQLSLYEELIEARFDRNIPYVSGGTSVTIPLIERKLLPSGINHFRVGETLFLGNNLYHQEPFDSMEQDVFTLYAEIIELIVKPVVPDGSFGQNVEGETRTVNEDDYGKTALRAILDIGLLDVKQDSLFPVDKSVSLSGASSDMIILEIAGSDSNYKVGDLVQFKLNYMGILSILSSSYIEKRLV
ncbi:MAG: alanine racemase [Marinilabiliaceae bacterium]|nr:alanine racemase [Marinilabiliaceae bacterium]